MKMQRVDLNFYEADPQFFPDIDILVTIKSFDLQAIRQRYIASRKNKSGKAGSVERRPVSEGGIAMMTLSGGLIQNQRMLKKLPEPRAIAHDGRRFMYSSEKTVYVIDESGLYQVDHPWFSYIHTAVFHPKDPEIIMVSSSGLDIILELNYKNREVVYEWSAWENGFSLAHDPHTGGPVFLTRQSNQSEEWKKAGIPHRLIDDPAQQTLPTAQRAAFINSVTYDDADPDYILATFFHEGRIYRIEKSTGDADVVLDGLKNPHGGQRVGDDILATSTGAGTVFLGHTSQTMVFDFSALPDKDPDMGASEWIQNTHTLDDFFISIDSNRNAFILFHPGEKKRCQYVFDNNWAVQDLVIGQITAEQSILMRGF